MRLAGFERLLFVSCRFCTHYLGLVFNVFYILIIIYIITSCILVSILISWSINLFSIAWCIYIEVFIYFSFSSSSYLLLHIYNNVELRSFERCKPQYPNLYRKKYKKEDDVRAESFRHLDILINCQSKKNIFSNPEYFTLYLNYYFQYHVFGKYLDWIFQEYS